MVTGYMHFLIVAIIMGLLFFCHGSDTCVTLYSHVLNNISFMCGPRTAFVMTTFVVHESEVYMCNKDKAK